MGEAVQPMHADFAGWYKAVSVDDDVARRDARWRGLCAVVSEAGRPEIEGLLRIAFGGRVAPAAQQLLSIKQSFKAADETFELSGNDREMQVLAAASLAVLMDDTENAHGAPAALSVTTAALAGARVPALPMDIVALAEAAIARHGEARLKRPILEKLFSAEAPKLDFQSAVTKVQQQPNWAGVSEAFALAAESTRAALQTVAKRQAKALQVVDDFLRIQDQELEMLWWLTGQQSTICGSTFDAVPGDARALVFATELAAATAFLPGPPSVRGILSRAGLKAKQKLAVTAAINASPANWFRDLMQDVDPSPVSAPLHMAIKRQLETGPGDAWIAGWAAMTGVPAAHTLPALTLAELFYRERLLIAISE